MSTDIRQQNIAHPFAHVEQGPHNAIPHPPPEDHPNENPPRTRPIPDTGWRGDPPIPSKDGGSGEKDFMKKPPYEWVSEGDKFKVKYRS